MTRIGVRARGLGWVSVHGSGSPEKLIEVGLILGAAVLEWFMWGDGPLWRVGNDAGEGTP